MDVLYSLRGSRRPAFFGSCKITNLLFCGMAFGDRFGRHFGSKLGVWGVILAPSWGSWRPSWLQVGGLGAILAPSWGSWGHLGSKLGGLGASLAPTWRSWGHLGSNLGGLGAILAPTWGILRPSWLQLGGLGGSWAPCWEVLGTMLGQFLASCCKFFDIPKTFKKRCFFNDF